MTDDKKNLALTGGAAAAEALKQIDPDVMPIYPITPQTPIIESFAKMVADGEAQTVMIEVESEHSAMSAAVGASAAGARAVTASSSQGIMLMAEMLPIASGMRLPILMLVSARAISAPINIHGDHQDVMFVRDSGWIQLFSENAQEVYDNTLIAMKLAEQVKLPAMVIMDGFTTSHSVENLEILESAEVREFVGEYDPKNYLLNFDEPKSFGPVSLPNSYFEFKRAQIEAMDGVLSGGSGKLGIYGDVCDEYAKISGREYGVFEEYKIEDAERVIIVAGSTAGTAKVAVDELREQGEKVGLLKIKLFRPFPYKQIADALKNARQIAALDRTVSFGSAAPLYCEIVNATGRKDMQPCIYGLGGREIFKEDIKKILRDLGNQGDQGVKFIGLK